MPVYRGRQLPWLTVDRGTVLNTALSGTSRLLYAVLLACTDTDDDSSVEHVAPLIGLQDPNELQPFLEELAHAGVVETKRHHGRPKAVRVYQTPLPMERRMRGCVPCGQCGRCSCDHAEGLCQSCDAIIQAKARAHEDVARWKRQRDAGATYALATRLHRWDCTTLSSPDTLDLQHGTIRWPRLPLLYTAEELRRKNCRRKRCAICGPDPL